MYRQFNLWVSALAPSTKLLRRNEEGYLMFGGGGVIGPLLMAWEAGKKYKKASTEDNCILRHASVNGFTRRIIVSLEESEKQGTNPRISCYCTQQWSAYKITAIVGTGSVLKQIVMFKRM
jgi:hypothetical protein